MAKLVPEDLGITEDGISTALDIKRRYREHEPVCVPGEESRILLPEFLLNNDLDLMGLEDPLPLAVMATRDPESPMAVAAVTRMGPLGSRSKLLAGVFSLVGETSKHEGARTCVELITEHDFHPAAIAKVRRHASTFIITTRRQYTTALRQNLRDLIDGTLSPRKFVQEFFQLTEAGNLRQEVRMRLVSSLLLAETIRPSIKFLFLENFFRFPSSVRVGIITSINAAEPSRHTEVIREELKWLIVQERKTRGVD